MRLTSSDMDTVRQGVHFNATHYNAPTGAPVFRFLISFNKVRGSSMGTSTDAHCYSCGYDVFLMLGGGRANHTTYAAWPVSCTRCSAVTTANFKNLPPRCMECGSSDVSAFDNPKLWKGDGAPRQRWGGLELTDGHYRCPLCDAFELRFGTNANGHGCVM